MTNEGLTVVYAISRSFLPYLRLSLATLPSDVHVIVVFVGDEMMDKNEFAQRVEWIYIRESKRFNKSKALNAALAHVSTSRVMIADPDFIIPSFLFNDLDLTVKSNVVYRFFIARFDARHTALVFAGQDPWEVPTYSGSPRLNGGGWSNTATLFTIYASNNPCVYDTNFLRSLGCYNEKFSKWAGEDDELYHRGLTRGAEEVRLPIIVAHLHHEIFRDFKSAWKQ